MLVPTDFEELNQRAELKRLSLFGSTGSIGCSTLEVVRQNRSQFIVELLTAHKNSDLFLKQLDEFRPAYAVVTDQAAFQLVKSEALKLGIKTKIEFGNEALLELISELKPELVVAAVVGMDGLPGVLKALDCNATVALANKESLVVAGELVAKRIRSGKGRLIPVDSEHSAIFQSLRGAQRKDIHSIVLTASGGPFLNTPIEEFPNITVSQALKHPKWKMGSKITIDSASMMNKALELIEAHWLFGIEPEGIEVVVHPQSIVHSAVRYLDGSMIAQLSYPDMKGPIAYALSYPKGRFSNIVQQLDLVSLSQLDFKKLDDQKFPAVKTARECIKAGGSASAVFNIANEWAVAEFLAEKVRFFEINRIVEVSLTKYAGRQYSKLEDLFELRDEIVGWLSKKAWS